VGRAQISTGPTGTNPASAELRRKCQIAPRELNLHLLGGLANDNLDRFQSIATARDADGDGIVDGLFPRGKSADDASVSFYAASLVPDAAGKTDLNGSPTKAGEGRPHAQRRQPLRRRDGRERRHAACRSKRCRDRKT